MLNKESIKIITEPTVKLVGRQELDSKSLDSFLKDHNISWTTDTNNPSEKVVELAGRLCYMSFMKKRSNSNKDYIDHILEVGHGSVLEHSIYNFIFYGISRSLTHELIRHRAGFGYSQLSQRYVDESEGEYIEPAIIARDHLLHKIWYNEICSAHSAYVELVNKLIANLVNERIKDSGRCISIINGKIFSHAIDGNEEIRFLDKLPISNIEELTSIRKQAREAARSVLPNATETKIFVTVNARALRHFIEMRASRFADAEIRRLANKLLLLMQKEVPSIFSDYKVITLEDGTFEVETPNTKV